MLGFPGASYLMSLSLMTSMTGQATLARLRWTLSSSGSSHPTLHSTCESRKVRTAPAAEPGAASGTLSPSPSPSRGAQGAADGTIPLHSSPNLPAVAQSMFSPPSHRGLQSDAGWLLAAMAVLGLTQPGHGWRSHMLLMRAMLRGRTSHSSSPHQILMLHIRKRGP